MMDKLVSEFKIIETDEGFRIEVKGDKDHMKAFMKEFHSHKKHHLWGRHRSGFGWGPFGYPPGMWMHMGPCWDTWTEEPEESNSTSKNSEA